MLYRVPIEVAQSSAVATMQLKRDPYDNHEPYIPGIFVSTLVPTYDIYFDCYVPLGLCRNFLPRASNRIASPLKTA